MFYSIKIFQIIENHQIYNINRYIFHHNLIVYKCGSFIVTVFKDFFFANSIFLIFFWIVEITHLNICGISICRQQQS